MKIDPIYVVLRKKSEAYPDSDSDAAFLMEPKENAKPFFTGSFRSAQMFKTDREALVRMWNVEDEYPKENLAVLQVTFGFNEINLAVQPVYNVRTTK